MGFRLPPPADLALAAGLLAVAEAEAATDGAGAITLVTLPLVVLPLALRRAAPLAMAAAMAAGTALAVAAGGAPHDRLSGLVALLIAAFAVGSRLVTPRAAVGLALLVVPLWITEAVTGDDGDYLFILVIATAPWMAGRLVRDRTQQAERIAALAAENERLAVQAERMRLARELHDSVAHAVSLMVVQAAAAEGVLDREPGRAREPLAAIQATGRHAVDELRRMLGFLREGGDDLAPPHGLGDLAQLAGETGADVSVEGEPRPVTPALEASAYRIVQEALTNVRKHAPGARAQVRVAWTARTLTLSIDDDGAVAPAAPNGRGTGQGLIGMRERVALFGGRLDAGRRPDGGFSVRAELPL